jgi:hypothetical protein
MVAIFGEPVHFTTSSHFGASGPRRPAGGISPVSRRGGGTRPRPSLGTLGAPEEGSRALSALRGQQGARASLAALRGGAEWTDALC